MEGVYADVGICQGERFHSSSGLGGTVLYPRPCSRGRAPPRPCVQDRATQTCAHGISAERSRYSLAVPEPPRTLLRRRDVPGTARFLTFSCYRRLRLFDNDRIKDRFVEVLTERLTAERLECIAWVVMPEHVHLIVHTEVEAAVTRFLQTLKDRFAREVLARWRKLDAAILPRLKTRHRQNPLLATRRRPRPQRPRRRTHRENPLPPQEPHHARPLGRQRLMEVVERGHLPRTPHRDRPAPRVRSHPQSQKRPHLTRKSPPLWVARSGTPGRGAACLVEDDQRPTKTRP